MAEGHLGHDELLVAALAAGDLAADELEPAEALVAECGECAALAADLRVISQAIAAVPARPRPRDFFLGPADAARLQPQGLRRLAAAIAAPRRQLARPLAGGLMMLGFAGLLVAGFPGAAQLGGSPSADRLLEFRASATPGTEIQGAPAVPQASGAALGEAPDVAGQGQSSAPTADPEALKATPEAGRDAVAGPSALVVGSVALLAIGALVLVASLLRPGPRRS